MRSAGCGAARRSRTCVKQDVLSKEEAEYRLAYRLLCPSDFAAKTFLDFGFPAKQLARHIYGYDESVYKPNGVPRESKAGLTMLFVGVCAVRKGLHFALEAWLQSPASATGTFMIAGDLSRVQEKLAPMLAHRSVKVLGHRNDMPELVRQSDILVLPSIEEGFGLVVPKRWAADAFRWCQMHVQTCANIWKMRWFITSPTFRRWVNRSRCCMKIARC